MQRRHNVTWPTSDKTIHTSTGDSTKLSHLFPQAKKKAYNYSLLIFNKLTLIAAENYKISCKFDQNYFETHS